MHGGGDVVGDVLTVVLYYLDVGVGGGRIGELETDHWGSSGLVMVKYYGLPLHIESLRRQHQEQKAIMTSTVVFNITAFLFTSFNETIISSTK